MFSRIFRKIGTVPFFLAAACGGGEAAEKVQDSSLPTVACGSDFSLRCTIETRGEILILTAPDGGFRRLRVVPGGVEAPDGAEQAMVTARKGEIDVRVGDDAYRLPATVQ